MPGWALVALTLTGVGVIVVAIIWVIRRDNKNYR